MPGNPWPHDMVLRIENDPHAVLEVLWIREAWGLAPTGVDLPPMLTEPPERLAGEPDPVWSTAWPLVWDAAVEQAAVDIAPLMTRVMELPDGAAERASLVRTMVGPSWRTMVGPEALPDAFAAWAAARFDAFEPPTRLEDDPERIGLDALIPAWRSGLTTIVTIPCRGTYTRRVAAHALLVTEETRADPRRYAEALAAF